MTRLMGGPLPAAGPVVLLLPGGGVKSYRRPGLLPYLRMIPFARALRRQGLVVRLLRYRYGGWNGIKRDPVRDVEWALNRLRPQSVLLVGHSMGARAAFWAGGDPIVIGVCGLAPWIEADDPWAQLTGKPVLIAHGSRDCITDPRVSREYAAQVGAQYTTVDDGHPMLRQPGRWTALVRDFALNIVASANPARSSDS